MAEVCAASRVRRRTTAALCGFAAFAALAHLAAVQFGLVLISETIVMAWLCNAGIVAAGSAMFVGLGRRGAYAGVDRLLGLAIWCWGFGNIYWWAALVDLEDAPFPSWADAGYTAFYAPAYIALILVVRARVKRFLPSVWLDGVIAMLSAAALGALVVVRPVLAGVGGTTAQVITNAAYPIGDLLLILIVLLTVALSGWRFDRYLALMSMGLLTFAVADSIYLYRVAADSYAGNTILDSLWIIGIVCFACTSLVEPTPRTEARYEGWAVTVVPALFGLVAIGVLVYCTTSSQPIVIPLLAAAGLVAVFARVALTFRDVRMLGEARHQAATDELTGLPNRRWLLAELERRVAVDGGSGSFAIVDLNRFKEINDTLGHQVGDELLRQVAARMNAAVGADGAVARLGGDEFAIIGAEVDTIERIATMIDAGLDAEFIIGDLALSITASIGSAAWPEHGADAVSLLRCADIALYDAKRSRQLLAVYSPRDDRHSVDTLRLTRDLRTAITNGDLHLVYQPKVSLRTGSVMGVEALARWDHPDRGPIPPTEFVALAEATGMIRSLTRYVLEQAIHQQRTWLDQGVDTPVSVNISAIDIIDVGLCTTVRGLLRSFRVPASNLLLEITETELLYDSDRSVATIDGLAELGVKVALDDFGTGYSSLRSLQSLSVHELKIDRGFVINMTTDRSDAAIVRCAIEMASALEIPVVAEGVENNEVAELLRNFGCDQAQGYGISRPLPPADFATWFHSRQLVNR